jgi:hypothetical protein
MAGNHHNVWFMVWLLLHLERLGKVVSMPSHKCLKRDWTARLSVQWLGD